MAAPTQSNVPRPEENFFEGGFPAEILVINCGSSSLKYGFYVKGEEGSRARGLVERVGLPDTRHIYKGPKGEATRPLPGAVFAEALQSMLAELTASGSGVIRKPEDIKVVAHRVVHGGEKFAEATFITDAVLGQIESLNPLAPLHNPVNIEGIRQLRRLVPSASHVAVFDTAFHHTLPPHAYLYGLPYELYQNHGVRRYGIHGTSHHYVSLQAARFLQRPPTQLRLVSCHLGNGSSLCAIHRGRSIDTSMGFTPAEGLIMGTRCGDVDVGVLGFLERTEGLTASQSEELLNKKSGLLGLSGISSDMREVLEAAGKGHQRALLGLHAYGYRLRKYVGAYVAALGGVDAVLFTGGIGQGSPQVRALALQGLDCMGIKLDETRNHQAEGFDQICRISPDNCAVEVLVVPTDEEYMLAREASRVLRGSPG